MLPSSLALRLVFCSLLLGLAAAAEPTRLTLLHINDTHAHVAPWGPKDKNLDGTLGGLSRAATIIARERAAAQGHALFVHSGDFLHGDVFFNQYLGIPELQILQQLGLDVLTLGNHEFQFGPEFLAGVLQAAGANSVSIVGTNLDLTGFPALGAWVVPTAIKEIDGLKVGFFGLTTPWDPLEIPEPVTIGTDLAGISAAAVKALRAAGAQVVVCLAHVDYEVLQQLGPAVSGIDVIVGGHTHMTLAHPEAIARPGGGTTWLVYAGSFYGWVGRLRLVVDGGAVRLEDYQLFPVDDRTAPMPEVQQAVDILQMGVVANFGDLYHDPIAWAEEPISDAPKPCGPGRDTPIGDLWTDAYRAATGTQIAVEASGFLDEGIPAGAVVGADIFRTNSYGMPVVPEDGSPPYVRPFRLATFLLRGAELIKGIEIGLAIPGGVFLQVSGMRFVFDSKRPPFSRVIQESVRIGGRALDPNRSYSVTANEGVLLFLPKLGVEASAIQVRDVTAYAAARALIDARGELEPKTDGRIRDRARRGCEGRR